MPGAGKQVKEQFASFSAIIRGRQDDTIKTNDNRSSEQVIDELLAVGNKI